MSTPGGGGYHELRIDDKKGSEEIYLHAQKDLEIYAKQDLKEWIGHERHLTVQNNQHIDIKKSQHLSVAKGHHLKTGKTLSRTIGKDQQIAISGSCVEQAGKTVSLKAGMILIIEAGTELTLKAGGGIVKLDPSGVTIKGPVVKINSGGAAIPAMPAVPTAPAAPTMADKGTGPGQVSALALRNGKSAASAPGKAGASTLTTERQAVVEKANPVSAPAASQALSARNMNPAAVEVTADSALTVKVSRSENQQAFANAKVKIDGPSGVKEAQTNAEGEAIFTGLLPGTYSAMAQLSESDSKQHGNPKAGQTQIKNNDRGLLPLQVSMRKVSIDVQMLGAQFAAHNSAFNGMKALLTADGITCEGVLEAGRLQFEVPATAQRFELSFADNQGITYLNSPKS